MGRLNRNEEPLRFYSPLFIQQLPLLALEGLKKTDCVAPLPYVVCFHSSARAAKRWPNENWVELALAFGIPILGLIFYYKILIDRKILMNFLLASRNSNYQTLRKRGFVSPTTSTSDTLYEGYFANRIYIYVRRSLLN